MKWLKHTYRLLQRTYPQILWFGDDGHRHIALTFDDGPHPLHTQPVLATLKKHHIHASFFLLGRYVEQYPQIVQQIHRHGHHVGIHGYRHMAFPLEQPNVLSAQLERTRQRLAELCQLPAETVCHVRPPYGVFTKKTLGQLTTLGYRVVLWNNLPPHWMQPLTWTIRQTLDQATPGGIIVLHDGHGHGTKVAQILEHLIPRLKADGYEFVTIPTLLRSNTHEH